MVLEVLCLMSVTRTRRFLSSVSMSVSFVESFFRSRFFGIVLWSRFLWSRFVVTFRGVMFCGLVLWSRFLWSRFVVTFRGVMFCGLVLWSQFVVVQARFQTRRSFGIAPHPFREERAKQVTCVGVASAT
jgi:hypothetical protein